MAADTVTKVTEAVLAADTVTEVTGGGSGNRHGRLSNRGNT